MRVAAYLRGSMWHWPLVGILLIGSLLGSSSREMHLLCLRLLLQLKGETFVQGQPPGCIIYTVPNVQFTEQHKARLRSNVVKSSDDYVVACATGNQLALEFPATNEWTNHALVRWAAFQLSWVAYYQRTDAGTSNETVSMEAALASLKTARQVVQHAQSVDPTNGALWLAEAVVCLGEQDDEAALVALRAAGANRAWNADAESSVSRIAKLYEAAGLSNLDAAIEATSQSPRIPTATLQGIIRRNLNRLMQAAVNAGDDEKFTDLLRILVELRKADWQDRGFDLRNNFRNFGASDELIAAMTNRMGRPFEADMSNLSYLSYRKERQLRREVFADFLDSHADGQTVARFWGQTDLAEAFNDQRRQFSDLRFKLEIKAWFYGLMAGHVSLLMLVLVVIAALSELPFAWLRRIGCQASKWPRQKTFWLAAALAIATSAFLFSELLSALGGNTEAGFGLVEGSPPSPINPRLTAALFALLLPASWFVLLLALWRMSKNPVNSWPLIAVFVEAYCLATFAAGYFRTQAAEMLMAGIF